MNEEKIELPESNTKNRFDELLEKFEISKSEMTNEQLQGFAKAVLKYASSNEEANKYIDQLLADILEKEERKSKFEVGEYYFAENMICRVDKMHEHLVQMKLYDFEVSDRPVVRIFNDDATCLKGTRKATDEEIKLFKRAEMYHKHGRKLDEVKIGDLMKSYNSQSPFALEYERDIELWSGDNSLEIYLTVEEQQEAYKKIVGE